MIVYPAIDLRAGQVVRLREGDPNQQTTFSDDPVMTARRWIDQGAAWLHVVNLDGTFAQANRNIAVLEQIAALGTPVQFGGGLRAMTDIDEAFAHGAARVILGTVAVEQPQIVEQALARCGAERVCIGLDARDGRVATHGWQQASTETPLTLGTHWAARGVRHALYTDVSRDGLLGGVNVEATAELARQTGLSLIASGGVSSLDDIRALAATGEIAGVVIGIALYTGRITLPEAIEAAGV